MSNGTIIVNILVMLINSMAMVLVAAYVLTRTSLFLEILEQRLSRRNQLVLTIVFGLFAIFGTYSGADVHGAVANTRYIGPVIAGLVGGPLVGLGAGLIGGLHRFLFPLLSGAGVYTAFASSLSTVVAGLAAGFFCYFRREKALSLIGATVCAAVVQVYHLGQILLICPPFTKAWSLVSLIGLPMLLANVGGVALFIFIIRNLICERKIQAERDTYLQTKERIESELRVATDIQMSMVPKIFTTMPARCEFDMYASLKSAKEVGGDLYDFYLLGDDYLFFTIGDVSDKGVPAALLMAVTKTLLKSAAGPEVLPATILSKANREIAAENESLMFVTVFYGILNLRTGELAYSNAGHNPPLILRGDGQVEWLKLPTGLVLGVDPLAPYQTRTITLNPGDAILAYTDGVTEAMNPARQLFSEARLLETVQQQQHACTAMCLVNEVANAVTAFADSAPQSDDITILAIRFLGTENCRVPATPANAGLVGVAS